MNWQRHYLIGAALLLAAGCGNRNHSAKKIADYGIIKLKLGSEDDESRVRAVRGARPDARLFIDANAGWNFDDAAKHLRWLSRFDIELIEQPLPRDQHAAMGELQKCFSF